MKYNPENTHTRQDAQLELIDQGYGHEGHEDAIDTHPVLDRYDEETGERLPAEQEVVGADEADDGRRREVEHIGKVAGTTRSQNELTVIDGVVLTPQEVIDLRDPSTDREPAGRY
jgi:hypothetical protein